MSAQLFVLSGADVGRSLEARDGLTIGRSRECALVLRDPSISRRHAPLNPVPCRISLLSRKRPTMSKFRHAATFDMPMGACSTKCEEPIKPISSPDHAANTMPRRNCSGCLARCAAREPASSSTAAVPDALSSAPGCIAVSSPWRRMAPASPNPR